jgi:hypothetical protein
MELWLSFVAMRGYSTKLHSSFEAIYLQRGSKEQSVTKWNVTKFLTLMLMAVFWKGTELMFLKCIASSPKYCSNDILFGKQK